MSYNFPPTSSANIERHEVHFMHKNGKKWLRQCTVRNLKIMEFDKTLAFHRHWFCMFERTNGVINNVFPLAAVNCRFESCLIQFFRRPGFFTIQDSSFRPFTWINHIIVNWEIYTLSIKNVWPFKTPKLWWRQACQRIESDRIWTWHFLISYQLHHWPNMKT